MIDLTNIDEIKKLDPNNIYGSTGMFVDQCKQIWEDPQKLTYPKDYQSIQNIVICGMGGSAYGGHVSLSLFKEVLSVPLVVVNNYHLPAFVNQNSLVILTSFSGSTEEIISCASEAIDKKAKITALTSGGKLSEILTENNIPNLLFNPVFNPSMQPRLGTGYIVLGTIAILNKIGLIKISDEEVKNALQEVKDNQTIIKEKAIELSKQIYGKIPVIFAAEFLEGNAHIIRNQFNETAKSFSAFSEIPELNHHLMEGLKNPPDKKLTVLFLDSNLYTDNIQTRIELTKDVVGKNNIEILKHQVLGKSKLSQTLYLLSFGGYLALYTALLYGQNPSVIPWVDYFKEQMEKKK